MTTSGPDAWQAFLDSLSPELRALYDDVPEDVIVVGGGRSVTLAELLDVLTEQVAPPPGAGQRRLRRDRYHPGLLAVAWRHTAFRQTRAVLTLFDAGLQVEARANARACLEHAVAVRRLALAADADQIEPLLTEMAYQAQQRRGTQLQDLEKLDAATGAANHALLQAARSKHEAGQIPPDKTRPKTHLAKDVFEAVPGGKAIYDSVYSQLSESTHAGLGSAIPYLTPALRTSAPMPARPEQGAWAQTAALLCWSCWAAEDAMLRFLDDSSQPADRQVQLLARIGLAPG